MWKSTKMYVAILNNTPFPLKEPREILGFTARFFD